MRNRADRPRPHESDGFQVNEILITCHRRLLFLYIYDNLGGGCLFFLLKSVLTESGNPDEQSYCTQSRVKCSPPGWCTERSEIEQKKREAETGKVCLSWL